MVELPLCLSTILEMFGGTDVLTFTHYELVSDNLMLQLLYFEKRGPSTHWISNRTTSDLMAVWAIELYSNSPQPSHLKELFLHCGHLKCVYTLQPKSSHSVVNSLQWGNYTFLSYCLQCRKFNFQLNKIQVFFHCITSLQNWYSLSFCMVWKIM